MNYELAAVLSGERQQSVRRLRRRLRREGALKASSESTQKCFHGATLLFLYQITGKAHSLRLSFTKAPPAEQCHQLKAILIRMENLYCIISFRV